MNKKQRQRSSSVVYTHIVSEYESNEQTSKRATIRFNKYSLCVCVQRYNISICFSLLLFIFPRCRVLRMKIQCVNGSNSHLSRLTHWWDGNCNWENSHDDVDDDGSVENDSSKKQPIPDISISAKLHTYPTQTQTQTKTSIPYSTRLYYGTFIQSLLVSLYVVHIMCA